MEVASDEVPIQRPMKPSTKVTPKIPAPFIKTEVKGKGSQKTVVNTKRVSSHKVRVADLPNFTQDSSWRTLFLPTLYDRFFASDKPFAKFIKGSKSFTEFVQTNISLVYPKIGYKTSK